MIWFTSKRFQPQAKPCFAKFVKLATIALEQTEWQQCYEAFNALCSKEVRTAVKNFSGHSF